jgi:hypothetical protein
MSRLEITFHLDLNIWYIVKLVSSSSMGDEQTPCSYLKNDTILTDLWRSRRQCPAKMEVHLH